MSLTRKIKDDIGRSLNFLKRKAHFPFMLFYRAAEDFLNNDCRYMAAAISYYALFSIFPLLIFLISVLGLFLKGNDLHQRIIEIVVSAIPASGPKVENMVIAAIRRIVNFGSGTISILGLLGLFWAASRMYGIIRHFVSIVYDLKTHRSFLRQKLIDFIMILLTGIFFLLSIAGTTLLHTIRRLGGEWTLLSQVFFLNSIIGEKGILWSTASYLIPFALTFILFSGVYGILPASRPRLRYIWVGAAIASLLFELCKLGFVLYLENFGRYDLIIGSLGAVVTFLFWIYISSLILLFGAEITAECSRIKEE